MDFFFSPSWVCFACDHNWWVIPPCPVSTQEPFIIFSPPHPTRGDEWATGHVVLCCWMGLNHDNMQCRVTWTKSITTLSACEISYHFYITYYNLFVAVPVWVFDVSWLQQALYLAPKEQGLLQNVATLLSNPQSSVTTLHFQITCSLHFCFTPVRNLIF